MAIAGLIVGICGTVVSIFALFYAFLAAHRSEALLRRLVVYPYRELDIAFAGLTAAERDALMELYSRTAEGSKPIDTDVIAQVRLLVPELSPQMLGFLAQKAWLQSDETKIYRISHERSPYLNFVSEAEGRVTNARA